MHKLIIIAFPIISFTVIAAGVVLFEAAQIANNLM